MDKVNCTRGSTSKMIHYKKYKLTIYGITDQQCQTHSRLQFN